MYICRVIGKEAVSASPRGLLQRTLGRAAEEARWRIKDARKGARGWKARGSRNWRVAGANMRQKCFSQNKRALGVFTALGFVKALFGSFGAWRSLRLFLGALGLSRVR